MGPRCPGQLMPSLEIPPWLGIEPLPGMREAVGSVLRTITPSTRNKNVLCPRRLLVFPSSTFCSPSSPCAVPSSFSFFASPLPFLSSHLSSHTPYGIVSGARVHACVYTHIINVKPLMGCLTTATVEAAEVRPQGQTTERQRQMIQ